MSAPDLSVFEWQASRTVGAARNLIHWVEKTRPDRIDWQPATDGNSNTRSVLEQMDECVRVNRLMAGYLRGEESPTIEDPIINSAEDAARELMASAEEMASALRGLGPEDIDKTIATEWGPIDCRELMVVPMVNMYYHGGQVNFIQRLYGDTEMYFAS